MGIVGLLPDIFSPYRQKIYDRGSPCVRVLDFLVCHHRERVCVPPKQAVQDGFVKTLAVAACGAGPAQVRHLPA